jgi:hypothetical protein
MKKIMYCVLWLSLLLTSSCDKCLEGDRATPASFFVTIVDATTDENVFENETFLPTQISVADLDGEAIPFRFIPNSNLIQLFPDTRNLTNNSLIITLSNEETSAISEITITHDVSEKVEECYTSYTIENIQTTQQASEVVDGIYVIKI